MYFDLSEFDKYKEDNRWEVKKAKGGLPNDLWESYSSFANCYGGVIILGVVENEDGSWKTTGLTNPRKLYKDFWNTVNNSNKVNLNLLSDKDVEFYTAPGTDDTIMVINVPAARREDKPVYINGDMFKGTYRRHFEGDYRCSAEEVKAMLRDAPETTADMKVIDNAPLSYINKQSVEAYRNRHRAYRPGHPWANLQYEDYVEQIGAASISSEDGKLHPTAAGLLMFGEEYHIVREFPEFFLDFREMLDPQMRWTDRFISSSGEWTGNLFDFYFTVYNKLIKNIKTPFRIEGGIRIDDTPVHKALREALANCLVNTDFYLPRAVVVKVDQEKIVLENPGSVRTGKRQMLKGGISDPRNKALMKMFNLIDIGERAGSGVPDIYSVWDKEGWNEPIVEEQYGPDRTILTLPLTKKASIKGGDNKAAIKKADKKSVKVDKKPINSIDKKPIKKADKEAIKAARESLIIDFISENGAIRNQEAREILNLADSTTKRLLGDMVKQGILLEVGDRKSRHYRFNKED